MTLQHFTGEAEQAVLGAILVRPEVMDQVVDIIKPEDLIGPGHCLIFAAMLKLYQESTPIDLVTVTQALRASGNLAVAGGPVFLATLSEQVGFAANGAKYAHLVRDKSLLRKLGSIGGRIVKATEKGGTDVRGLLDKASAAIFDLADQDTRSKVEGMPALVEQLRTNMESIRQSGVSGIPTGFTDLDRILCGLRPADLIILAARPSMGKTALALNIAHSIARYQGKPSLFFSLEMASVQLMMRLASSTADLEGERLRIGLLDNQEWARLEKAYTDLAALPLFVDDAPNPTPSAMKARARRLASKEPLGLIVVDYLQLAKGDNGNKGGREQEVADISRALKGLAKEMRCPVLALAQLNRKCEERPDKRPILSDLRESGQIEQDADVIMFIYRDEVYNPSSPDVGLAEVLVRKQRNGPTGQLKLTYTSKYVRFDNATFLTYPGEN